MSRAKDFFEDEEAFEEILEEADCNCKTKVERDFIMETIERYDRFGIYAFMTEDQANWIKSLADR